jgi:hypothetical protein
VMRQLGHTDPAFTLRVYAHAMRRNEEERARLKALVEGHDWSHISHKTAESTSVAAGRDRGWQAMKPGTQPGTELPATAATERN